MYNNKNNSNNNLNINGSRLNNPPINNTINNPVNMRNNINNIYNSLARRPPDAVAILHGSENYPDIEGTVSFYQSYNGVYVVSSIQGLPSNEGGCGEAVLGLHIHNGRSCSGNDTDPFANTGTHYNPEDYPHPYHAGDLPPLFVSGGQAWEAVLTKRFNIGEIIGRTVIIHSRPDDFTTQPAGNSGEKIACGKIMKA